MIYRHPQWRRFPADTILISPTQYAHLPGACTHLTEELVKAPGWGWIPTRAPGLWGCLGSSCPAVATAPCRRTWAPRLYESTPHFLMRVRSLLCIWLWPMTVTVLFSRERVGCGRCGASLSRPHTPPGGWPRATARQLRVA